MEKYKEAISSCKLALRHEKISTMERLECWGMIAKCNIANEKYDAALWAYSQCEQLDEFIDSHYCCDLSDLLQRVNIQDYDEQVFFVLSKMLLRPDLDGQALADVYFKLLAKKLKIAGSDEPGWLELLRKETFSLELLNKYLIRVECLESIIRKILSFLASNKNCICDASDFVFFLDIVSKQIELSGKTYSFPKHMRLSVLPRPKPTDKTEYSDGIAFLGSSISNSSADEKLRRFYEEYPYPLWSTIPSFKKSSLNEYFRALGAQRTGGGNNKVLIAGCGTGRHAIQFALTHPDSKVTGIDISFNSLRYAHEKSVKFGVRNLEFLHGNISAMPSTKKKFCLIEAVGVLHHMESPDAGLSALLDCLEEKGVMKLGLYSSAARMVRERLYNCMSLEGIEYSLENLEKVRNLIISRASLFPEVVSSPDFYSRQGCADLLFNFQEVGYNFKELDSLLHRWNLEFCGFESGDVKISRLFRKFDTPTSVESLFERLSLLEQKTPSLFGEMYRFWVRRRVG